MSSSDPKITTFSFTAGVVNASFLLSVFVQRTFPVATSTAQKTSREIPPCMAMGEAVGVAAAMALDAGTLVRNVDVPMLQKKLRAQGADPGDVPSANATLREVAKS